MTARLRKVLALLDSDQVGEVRAAGRALHRLLDADPAALPERTPERARERRELEACLTYAAEAITALTGEITRLRRANLALRDGAPAPIGYLSDCYPGKPPRYPSARPRGRRISDTHSHRASQSQETPHVE
jgi:hypothetical protein